MKYKFNLLSKATALGLIFSLGALSSLWAMEEHSEGEESGLSQGRLTDFFLDEEDAERQYNLGLAFKKKKLKTKAYREFRKAADGGSAAARYRAGLMLLSTEKNAQEGIHLIKLAADQGFDKAQYRYGVMLFNGIGMEKNETEAALYMEKARGLKYRESEYFLGFMYKTGRGLPQNNFNAKACYQDVLDGLEQIDNNFGKFKSKDKKNDARALFMKGMVYKYGLKDLNSAFKAFSAAARKGYAEAQYQFALMYKLDDIFINQDLASHYFELASDQGHSGAQTEMGLLYQQGKSVKKNEQKAQQYFERSTAQREKLGEYLFEDELAIKTLRIQGKDFEIETKNHESSHGDSSRKEVTPSRTVKDSDKEGEETLVIQQKPQESKFNNPDIFDSYLRETHVGNANAQFEFGLHWKKDKQQIVAFGFFKSAAMGGLPAAQYRTGRMLFKGRGTEKNEVEGIELIKQAALSEYKKAEFKYGQMLFLGRGVKENVGHAIPYLKRGCGLEYCESELFLGLIFKKGRKVYQDLDYANRCFQSALEGLESKAKKEDVRALCVQGKVYKYGQEKLDLAFNAFMGAATLGSAEGQYQLAIMFEGGEGPLKKDPGKANQYFRLAANRGHKDAQAVINGFVILGKEDDKIISRW